MGLSVQGRKVQGGKVQGRNRRGGFTLVELLVTVAIVGILASIAINQYASYRRHAIDSTMISDLHHGRVGMEAYYERTGSYGGATVPILVSDFALRQSAGVTLAVLSASASDYSLRACASNGNFLSYHYDSAEGQIVGENVACP